MTNELRERVAAVQHAIWSHWMKYMFAQGMTQDGSWVMPQENVERWQRQMNTPYSKLSERERESDRAQADKVMAVMKKTKKTRELFEVYRIGLEGSDAESAFFSEVAAKEMIMRYTPAPWSAELLNEGRMNERWRIGNADADNDIIAECMDYVDDPAERDANACLIKAAPQLFEALKRLVENGYMDGVPSSSSIADEVRAALEAACPLISASGRG